MSESTRWRRISRRDLLKAMGLGAAAVGLAPSLRGEWLGTSAAQAAGPEPPANLKLVGTDGWISLPKTPSIGGPPFHPDNLAPDGLSTYIFGFRNVTGLDTATAFQQKNKAQHSAPLFWAKEGEQFLVQLTNVGLAQRPDLFDAHTLHWHGFKNVMAVLRRRADRLGLGPGRPRRSPTSTCRTTRARTCTTATSRTWSTCTWA